MSGLCEGGNESPGSLKARRPRRRWEDNIKMDLKEVGYDDRDWINLAQDRDRWRAYEALLNRQKAYEYVNVWTGVVDDCLIGPYLLPSPLNSNQCYNFLATTLPDMLDDVSLATRRYMWFQHDGVPAHFTLRVRDYLNQQFPGKWIVRDCPVPWPHRSPDLTPPEFFVLGQMRNLVYATAVESEDDLVARIFAAAGEIYDNPDSLENSCLTFVTFVYRSIEEEEKELVESQAEKKVPTEGRTGWNGEREKSSWQKKISDDR
ncbi:hypothetical protein ANN_22092 [Periplaneta americana]|uniref:Uncharacterized protein n=1 Tax=Periplaneta americana TaxID=6978 RepID=A0ABQ8S7F7_PERAM|nr:hypothetical protein ANN_22092 [Periplaneta americana]